MSGLDEALDRYFELLRTGPPEAENVVPQHRLRRMSLALLERALADPARVAGQDGLVPDRSVDRLRNMMRFALWLRLAPPELLPADFTSRAARYRFLVWTLPLRLGWPDALDVERLQFGATADTIETWELGTREVLAEARAARTDWLGYLENWEQDPWLAARYAAEPDLTEIDLRWVTTTWVGPDPSDPDRRERPLSLAPTPAEEPADHRAVAQLVVEQHWLTRGAVLAAARAYFPGRWARFVPFAGPVVAAVPAGMLLLGLADPARWVAAGVVAAAVLGAGFVRPAYTPLTLARVPSAIAVGQAVLLSLTPRWWLAENGWLVGLGLLVLALGYLVYDSRAHGSRRWRAVHRGAGLLGVAAVYAFCISIAVLGFVAPAVAERGECLDGWWTVGAFERRSPSEECTGKLDLTEGAALPAAASVLTLMAGWSLGVGLAAQVLWDDRPISAPLGRVRRVRGAS